MNKVVDRDRAIKIHGPTYDELMRKKRLQSVKFNKNCTIDGVIRKLLLDSEELADLLIEMKHD